MRVTDVRLRKMDNQDNRMKALVSITFEDAFVIHDLRVIEGNNGLFVAMPSKRTPDNEFRDIAHPINSNMRQHIQEEVMKVYHDTPSDSPNESNSVDDEIDVNESSDTTNQSTVDPHASDRL